MIININNIFNENEIIKKEVGLDISITDTAIFKQGKLKWVVMKNKHGRVFANYNVKNISLHRIRLWFSNAMHKRWKEKNFGSGCFEPFNLEDKLSISRQRKHENIYNIKADNNGKNIHLQFYLLNSFY